MAHEQVFARIYRQIVRNKGLLPGLPGLALRLREVVANPQHSLEDLARMVQTDPGATAYLLQVANSALFTTRLPAQDVKSAIRRFGIPVTRNLILAYSARQLFSKQPEAIERAMAAIWKASVLRSAHATLLAVAVGLDGDRALLAALLEEVGSLPVMTWLVNERGQLPPPVVLRKFLHALTPRVSALLLQRWGLDDAMVDVALHANEPERKHDGPVDLVDVVCVARLLWQLDVGMLEQWPGVGDVPALVHFGDSLKDRDSARAMLEASRQKVMEIQRLLH